MVKKLRTELAVKKALNIDSFRNLSKNKIIEFVSLMPQIDRDLALSIINQFPNYASTVGEMINHLKDVCTEVVRDNASSMKSVAEAYGKILDDLGETLKRDDLSSEEREFITKQMISIADKMAAKDTENKRFLTAIANRTAEIVVFSIFILAAVLGVNIRGAKNPFLAD